MDASVQTQLVSGAAKAAREQTQKPALLLIATFLSGNGGSHSVMEDLAMKLRTKGYELVTASPYRSPIVRGSHMVSTTVVRSRHYDAAVVDVYSGRAFLWAEGVCSALSLLGKPHILVLRGGNLPAFASRWPSRVRRLLNSAAIVTTPSNYLFELMKPYRSNLVLVPNPLSLQAYEFRLRRGVAPSLIWLRSFHSIYNPSLAPRVLAIVKNEFTNATLTMIGRDKEDGSFEQTKQTASRLDVETSVHLPGPVDKSEVPGCLNQGDIFLNTTNIDNTPVSVLEAMACGLCVVTTNVGGIPYLLKHEHDALLVPPDDEVAMASAVRRILTEPELAERLSRNARLKAAEFDWSSIFPKWEQILNSVSKNTFHARY